jgi:hypothetical protein
VQLSCTAAKIYCILRAPDPADRDQMREVLVGDLRRAVEQIRTPNTQA